MNYPQDFFNKMFAWGRPLELARRFAVYFGILVFLIFACIGTIYWARRSMSARPYFIYAGDGAWSVFSERIGAGAASAPWHRVMQESLALRFAEMYFRITGDMAANEGALWCRCAADSCAADSNQCAVCCASGTKAYSDFAANVLPLWRGAALSGVMSELVDASARPIGRTDERGGFWEITADLVSNAAPVRRITAYARIGTGGGRGASLGFFVSEFYFYSGRGDE
ncbi:MAG: hypothetical protein LBB08_01410 [Rickettsiales bacterium]|jgi:hypothetical protein|nr:hypothetical protein [Rickettsiales bacterium]